MEDSGDPTGKGPKVGTCSVRKGGSSLERSREWESLGDGKHCGKKTLMACFCSWKPEFLGRDGDSLSFNHKSGKKLKAYQTKAISQMSVKSKDKSVGFVLNYFFFFFKP